MQQSLAFIHVCRDCGQPFRSDDPGGKRCFFCAMAAEEEEEILPAEPGDFDQFVFENRTPEEWGAWVEYNRALGIEVPHFRSDYIGNKTVARRVTERCPDCGESCVSMIGCPFR